MKTATKTNTKQEIFILIVWDIRKCSITHSIISLMRWITARLDKYCMFDISDDLSGLWIDTSIDELKKAVDL